MNATACRHGFDPDVMAGVGWKGGCPSCEYENRLPQPVRFVAQHPHWGPWLTVFSLGLSVAAAALAIWAAKP